MNNSTNQYDQIVELTKNTISTWSNSRGIAINEVADRMDQAQLQWLDELTVALKIWIDKGDTMTDGELILAHVNLGAVVEAWLMFFYTVFYDDYCQAPIKKKDKKTGEEKSVEPSDASFEQLKQFSNCKISDGTNTSDYKWIDSIQKKRNAIHAFRHRDIGTLEQFFSDFSYLYVFLQHVVDHFPPLEDYI